MQKAREGTFRCEFQVPGHTRQLAPCGCWLYLAAAAQIGTFLVAVDDDEVEALAHLQTADEVFTFLQVWPD